MINSLYVFSKDLPVVAAEWNANFNAITKSNTDCAAAIVDANSVIAFEDSNLTSVYDIIKQSPNSFNIPGNNITLSVNCEYYKALATGSDLIATIPADFEGECRIIISTTENRVLAPITFIYTGDVVWKNGIADWYLAGTKAVFIYVINGTAYIKMIQMEN